MVSVIKQKAGTFFWCPQAKYYTLKSMLTPQKFLLFPEQTT